MNWHEKSDLIYYSNRKNNNSKIAAFDLDYTLIKNKIIVGKKFQQIKMIGFYGII